MSVVTAAPTPFQIVLGPGPAPTALSGQPVLAGAALEQLFPAAKPAGRVGEFAVFESDAWLVGAATVPGGALLEASTARLYRDLFAASRGLSLARIWNYVPAINVPGVGGLENYRAFCRARSVAFEQEFGATSNTRMPAASAVGCDAPQLTVVFAASRREPRHWENPEQVPAYEYPCDYGPRAPSFARATLVPQPDGALTVFVSGTAAIRGHASVAIRDTAAQVRWTLENLRSLSRAGGLGDDLAATRAAKRHFKIYVRHAAEQPAIAAALEQNLLRPGDQATYVRADICRTELTVEIEATLFGVK